MPWMDIRGTAIARAHDPNRQLKRLCVFQDSGRGMLSRTLKDNFAEHYLTMPSDRLLGVYAKEKVITAKICHRGYVIPISYAVDNTGGSLSSGSLSVKRAGELYVVPKAIAAYTDPILADLRAGRYPGLSDGHVLRIRAIKASNGSHQVDVQPGSYFDALATNFGMDHCPSCRADSLRRFLSESNQELGNFEVSPLVNHIGVVCMVESRDGMLVVQRRSADVANRPNSLSASISGGVTWDDIKDRHVAGFKEMVIAVKRESVEELGVDADMVFLSLTREFLRGGKPEAYFFGRSSYTFREIKEAVKNSEVSGVIGFPFESEDVSGNDTAKSGFMERVERILLETERYANLTLIAGTIMAADRLLGGVLCSQTPPASNNHLPLP